MKDEIKDLIGMTEDIVSFWSRDVVIKDWAPDEVADELTKISFTKVISIVHSLDLFVDKDELTDGELLLAWTQLGSIAEWYLKFFLCVSAVDYLKNPKYWPNKIDIISPHDLRFEYAKQVFRAESILDKDLIEIIEVIQYNRNAIHLTDFREIADEDTYRRAVHGFIKIVSEIYIRLPL